MDDEPSQAIVLAPPEPLVRSRRKRCWAHEGITGDPAKVLRQMSFIITQLAETVAEHTRRVWTAGTVLQHCVLDAEDDDGDELAPVSPGDVTADSRRYVARLPVVVFNPSRRRCR